MESATITFVNGEKITVEEGDLMYPISRAKDGKQLFSVMGDLTEISSDHHFGIVPDLLDLFASCDFFSADDACSAVYSASSIVSIKRN